VLVVCVEVCFLTTPVEWLQIGKSTKNSHAEERAYLVNGY